MPKSAVRQQRESRQTHRQTDRQRDTQDNYCNPRTCAPKVNKYILDIVILGILLHLVILKLNFSIDNVAYYVGISNANYFSTNFSLVTNIKKLLES